MIDHWVVDAIPGLVGHGALADGGHDGDEVAVRDVGLPARKEPRALGSELGRHALGYEVVDERIVSDTGRGGRGIDHRRSRRRSLGRQRRVARRGAAVGGAARRSGQQRHGTTRERLV